MSTTAENFRFGQSKGRAVPQKEVSAGGWKTKRLEPFTQGAGDEAEYLDALAQFISTVEAAGSIVPETDASDRPLWLDDVYSLVVKAKPDAAVDVLFARVDELLRRREFDRCDSLLRAVDLGRLDTNLMVALLSITQPAASKLKARLEVVEKIEKHLRLLAPDRAERLLSGLR